MHCRFKWKKFLQVSSLYFAPITNNFWIHYCLLSYWGHYLPLSVFFFSSFGFSQENSGGGNRKCTVSKLTILLYNSSVNSVLEVSF